MGKLLHRHIPVIAVIYTLVPVTAAAVVTYLLVRKTLGPEPAAAAVVLYLLSLAGLAALVFRFYPKAFGLRRGNTWWVRLLRSASGTSGKLADKDTSRSSAGRSK